MKKKIIFILLFLFAFSLGGILDSFFGPAITVTHLSEAKTKELALEKLSGNELEDALMSFIDDRILDISRLSIPDCVISEIDDIYTENPKANFEYIKNKAHSGTLKGFIKDLEDNDLLFIKEDVLGYTVVPDFRYFEEKYGGKLSADANKYLSFRATTNEESIFDTNNECFDISKIVKRIDYIESVKSASEYVESYEEIEDYYLDILLGNVLNYHLDMNDEHLSLYAQKEYMKYVDREDEIGTIAKYMVDTYGRE